MERGTPHLYNIRFAWSEASGDPIGWKSGNHETYTYTKQRAERSFIIRTKTHWHTARQRRTIPDCECFCDAPNHTWGGWTIRLINAARLVNSSRRFPPYSLAILCVVCFAHRRRMGSTTVTVTHHPQQRVLCSSCLSLHWLTDTHI